MESGEPLESILPAMTSANAYLGADLICRALETKAAVVITGRVGDPSLFLAPALHHFGWSYNDSDKLAVGSLAGHLLECSTQVRSEEHTSELQSLMRISYAVFCWKK